MCSSTRYALVERSWSVSAPPIRGYLLVGKTFICCFLASASQQPDRLMLCRWRLKTSPVWTNNRFFSLLQSSGILSVGMCRRFDGSVRRANSSLSSLTFYMLLLWGRSLWRPPRSRRVGSAGDPWIPPSSGGSMQTIHERVFTLAMLRRDDSPIYRTWRAEGERERKGTVLLTLSLNRISVTSLSFSKLTRGCKGGKRRNAPDSRSSESPFGCVNVKEQIRSGE